MTKRNHTTVSLPTKDLDRLREIAEREHRSMAQQISYWIEQEALKQFQGKAS